MTHRRRRAQAARGRDECLGMLVLCIGGAAIIAFISPRLLLGAYGLIFGIGAVLSIILAAVFHLRQGGSATGALVLVLFTASITTGSLYGVWWYFFIHIASQPLFTFESLGQTGAREPARGFVVQPSVLPADGPGVGLVVSPSPSLMPAQTCGRAVVYDVDALALRAKPTRSPQQLAAVARGTPVDLACEDPIHADNIQWYKVRLGAIEGWMSARYLQVQQP